jgi:hypothetical protein
LRTSSVTSPRQSIERAHRAVDAALGRRVARLHEPARALVVELAAQETIARARPIARHRPHGAESHDDERRAQLARAMHRRLGRRQRRLRLVAIGRAQLGLATVAARDPRTRRLERDDRMMAAATLELARQLVDHVARQARIEDQAARLRALDDIENRGRAQRRCASVGERRRQCRAKLLSCRHVPTA